jgi:NAD-dependent dihydropyrimidine dehydrogenase PreA subunit
MRDVVAENGIRCEYVGCVNVWPVGHFDEREIMPVVHPYAWIDCRINEAACPAAVITPASDA